MKVRAIVVGRHPLSGEEGIEEVGRIVENLPATSSEVVSFLREKVFPKAAEREATVVFQAVPGQLAVALARIAAAFDAEKTYYVDPASGFGGVPDSENKYRYPRCGVIISVPGPREAGVSMERSFFDECSTMELVGFANPRAKIERVGEGRNQVLRVTCDPPMRFVFSHIEWL